VCLEVKLEDISQDERSTLLRKIIAVVAILPTSKQRSL
jgi:hypothetical protein